MYYLTDFNGTTIVPSSQMIHSLNLEELSVFLNLCDSQSVLFSISVFLNLCDSQLVFFSICAFLNQCFSQLVLFSISAIWGRHPMLYFKIPRTKKCSIAMCQRTNIMSIFADGQPGWSFAQHLFKSHFCHSTIHTLVPQWLRYMAKTLLRK